MATDKNPEPITSFRGANSFLSNFYRVNVELDGLIYPSIEHAYQAAKTSDIRVRLAIRATPTSGDAKRAGQKVTIRADWDDVKVEVMLGLLRQKFKVVPLRMRLFHTDQIELIEGNWWGDTFWGVCRGKGENHLGKLLMQVRDEINEARREEQ